MILSEAKKDIIRERSFLLNFEITKNVLVWILVIGNAWGRQNQYLQIIDL